MVREDLGKTMDMCQEAKRPCGSGRPDSPSQGFIHAVVTRAQKRWKQDRSPDIPDKNPDINSDPEEISSSPIHTGKCHRHRNSIIEQSVEMWTPRS